MQHIKKNNVAGEVRQRLLNILVMKINVRVMGFDNSLAVPDLSRIQIESEDPLPANTLAQIKREQTDAAPQIENRLGRVAQQFVGGGINGIAAQFAAHISSEPELRKLRRHSRASRLVFVRIASPVFHLLRIIALPD